MLSLKNRILTTAMAIGLFSVAGAADTANAQDGSYMPPQEQQTQADVSNGELEEFARAQMAISEIQAQYQNQVANVETQEEMTSLQQQANEQMVQAIEETELSVEEYNQIANAIQADPQLQEQYMNMIR